VGDGGAVRADYGDGPAGAGVPGGGRMSGESTGGPVAQVRVYRLSGGCGSRIGAIAGLYRRR
jgi:hypothetical protein